MFSREFRRPKRAKLKIYLIFEDCRGFRCGSLFGVVVVSTWAGGRGTLAILLTLAKMDKIPAFRPLSCFALGALPANMPLFRVLRGFQRVLGVSCGFMLLACFAWLVGLLCA